MKGTVKKIKDKWYIEYNKELLQFDLPSDLEINEGLQVEFEMLKNLNHGWRSNESERYARLINLTDIKNQDAKSNL